MEFNEQAYQAWLIEEAQDHTHLIGQLECADHSAAKLIEYKLDEILDMGVDTSFTDHAAADSLLRRYFKENAS